MKSTDLKIDFCPFCNGSEFVEAKQSGYACISGCENAWSSQDLYHVICRGCGSVVRSYVKEPEKLLKRKNRKSE